MNDKKVILKAIDGLKNCCKYKGNCMGCSSCYIVNDVEGILEENTKLKAEIEQYQKETSSDKIDYAYDLGYQSCLNHNGVGWVDAEEIQKLRKEIEQLNGIISRDMDKHECYVISKSIEVNNLKVEIEQLKEELEQSVKLPCKVGDKLFSTENGYIEEFKVRSLNHIVNLVEFSRFDETVFLTREEAEQHLKFEVENGN